MLKFGAKISLILILLVFVAYFVMSFKKEEPSRFIAFSVESGESFKSVSRRLKSEELIESEPFFYYLSRLTGKSAELKAGEYELNDNMSNWEILKVITGSEVKLYRITVREGMNMFQIARLLRDQDLVDELQFLEAAWDKSFVNQLNIPSISVEGYLFPETYYIARGTSARKIIRMFVEMFWDKVPNSFIEAANKGPLSLHEAVTLASMIEKETGYAGEMATISSVFYNRIAKGMKLQSDPTAIYDIMPYGGRVKREHLFRKTLFNTYQIKRLPYTPISNPGILAIQAALFPEKTQFLFFVSRRDGSHEFTTNYEDHKKAIDRYLR